VRGTGDRPPPTNLDKYPCICPLTIFLQLVAHSLTRSYVKIVFKNKEVKPPQQTDPWGDVVPLQRTLVSLNQQLVSMKSKDTDQDPYYPGVSQCIMFHNEDSQLTVTSSST